MENFLVSNRMSLIEPLSMELKLEILLKLAENVKINFVDTASTVDKKKLLEELSGSWKDVDENVIEEIFQNRTTSHREFTIV